MEASQRRGVNLEDISDNEEEQANERSEELQQLLLDREEDRIIKALTKTRTEPRLDLPTCKGGLNSKEFMDLITKMDKYFGFENTEEKQKVEYAC